MLKLIWLRLTGQSLDFFSLQERREFLRYQNENVISRTDQLYRGFYPKSRRR